MDNLNKMRKDIRNIDKKIVELIAKRIDIARDIGYEKKKRKMLLRNQGVEKSAIEHTSQLARKLGLSVQFVETIMQQVIIESRIQQERLHYSFYNGGKKNIFVVGGLGEMGKWFSNFFASQGHNVSIYDIAGKSKAFRSYNTLKEGMKKSDFILIATPMEVTLDVIKMITDMNYQGVVFDIASLKGYLADTIRTAVNNGISIASIHPLFGPDTHTLSDKIVCFCNCGDDIALSKVKTFFKDTAAITVQLSIDEHDRLISYILGLSHFINILFIMTLMKENNSSSLMTVASTTFASQIKTARSVINDNPELYYSIQKLNPYRNKLYSELRRSLEEIVDIVESERIDDFIKIIKRGKEWLKQE